MGRYRSGSITIPVYDLLQEVDDEDLIAECEDRGIVVSKAVAPDGSGRMVQPDVPEKLTLSSWDAENLREAIVHDDGKRAIDVLKAVLQ